MGDIFSNTKGTEKNYNADLSHYQLAHNDIKHIDIAFENIKDIGLFYQNDTVYDLESLWHRFCYKHKLIFSKIRLESVHKLYTQFSIIKYEIGFNALWHFQNNEKMPIQCFKLEKANKASLIEESLSDCCIYIGLKNEKQIRLDFIHYIKRVYAFDGAEGMMDIMCILCSFLPSHHIFNYKRKESVKLCHITLSTSNKTGSEQLIKLNDLVRNKEKFLSVIDHKSMQLMCSYYGINEHEILQFVKYMLFFFYHKYVDEWTKSKCNYHSEQSTFMHNALNEVMNIWMTQRLRTKKNNQLCHVRKITVQ